MKKRIILCALVMVLFLSLDVSAASKFKDVKETAWYYKYLTELVDAKVIDGMPDGTFQGQNTLNADQLLKLMVTTVNPYASYERPQEYEIINGVKKISYRGAWFQPYLDVLINMDLIDPKMETVKTEGYSTTSATNLTAAYYNKPITREEVAYWIQKGYDFLRLKNEPYDKVSDSEIRASLNKWYTDAGNISDEYKNAVYLLHECGIMEGGDNGGFWPKKVLTRAEVTAVIYRLQRARWAQLAKQNIDYNTDGASTTYVLRANPDGTQRYAKVLVKDGYVYSTDGMSEVSGVEYTGGIGLEPVSVKAIDVLGYTDVPDAPLWGEDEADFTEEEKAEILKMAGLN